MVARLGAVLEPVFQVLLFHEAQAVNEDYEGCGLWGAGRVVQVAAQEGAVVGGEFDALVG